MSFFEENLKLFKRYSFAGGDTPILNVDGLKNFFPHNSDEILDEALLFINGLKNLDAQLNDESKKIIINVLSKKDLENYNWFSYCIGLLVKINSLSSKAGLWLQNAKKDYLTEEYFSASIDNTKDRISSGDLLKSEIGDLGWAGIGFVSWNFLNIEIKNNYNPEGSKLDLSNRKLLKLKKEGKILEEDKKFISVFARNDKYILYYLPALTSIWKSYFSDYVASRKRLLCKYGRNTDWCTAVPAGDADADFISMPIYILHEINSSLETPDDEFFEKLKEAKSLGQNQDWVAKQLGVSESTIKSNIDALKRSKLYRNSPNDVNFATLDEEKLELLNIPGNEDVEFETQAIYQFTHDQFRTDENIEVYSDSDLEPEVCSFLTSALGPDLKNYYEANDDEDEDDDEDDDEEDEWEEDDDDDEEYDEWEEDDDEDEDEDEYDDDDDDDEDEDEDEYDDDDDDDEDEYDDEYEDEYEDEDDW